MQLVGFGCSYTYGSELAPGEGNTDHWKDARYRNKHCWLGCLAEKIGATSYNLAEESASNYSIQYNFANWFNTAYDPSQKVVVCVAWTNSLRFSWWDSNRDCWVHDGYLRGNLSEEEKIFHPAFKIWLTNSSSNHIALTDAAKLFVNSVCKANDIPILQFNAWGDHSNKNLYPNYFMNGNSMHQFLEQEMIRDKNLDLFAPGMHPNEAGHEYFTKRLYNFAKERIIL